MRSEQRVRTVDWRVALMIGGTIPMDKRCSGWSVKASRTGIPFLYLRALVQVEYKVPRAPRGEMNHEMNGAFGSLVAAILRAPSKHVSC